MNDHAGCLHFFANFDSGNLETASLTDPLSKRGLGADDDSTVSDALGGNSSLITNSSRRLSGRLASIRDQQYFLTVSSDCAGQGSFESPHNRSWFYFGVTFLGDASSCDDDTTSHSTDGIPTSRGSNLASTKPSALQRAAAPSSSKMRPSVRHRATFTIVNLMATNLIFDHDNRPVYCNDNMTEWDRLPQPLVIQYYDKNGSMVSAPSPSILQQLHQDSSKGVESSRKFAKGWHQCTQRVSWTYTFTSENETVYFAMCYPFSYHKQQQLLEQWWRNFGEDRGASELFAHAQKSTSIPHAPSTLTRSVSGITTKAASQRTQTPPPPKGSLCRSAPVTPVKLPESPSNASPIKSSRTERRFGTTASRDTDTTSPPPAAMSTVSNSQDSAVHSVTGDPSMGIYYVREVLCFSIQQRKVDLLTISGRNGMHPEGCCEPHINQMYPIRSHQPRPVLFPEKKYVLITARVHPGETPASYVLLGLIEFLLNTRDPRAVALRQHFVFKIVPMLNPDGVASGHYRTDTRGVNLNRMYDAPDPKFHPTIHATKQLFQSLEATGKLVLYMDLHAHASKRGCFVFGNAWDDDATQARALLYPKILSLNSVHFDFPSCDFTSRSMNSGNRQDGTTKGGTGRVALASTGSLVECYTLEASYCMGLSLNAIVALPDVDRLHAAPGSNAVSQSTDGLRRTSSMTKPEGGTGGRLSAVPTPSTQSQSFRYSPETYSELGRGIVVSLLDLECRNPHSRLPLTPFHSVPSLQTWLEKQLRLLHAEQQRMDATERHKTVLEHNKALERVGITLQLPMLNAYNNHSQNKLTRDENGAVVTVRQIREQLAAQAAGSAPVRLLC